MIDKSTGATEAQSCPPSDFQLFVCHGYPTCSSRDPNHLGAVESGAHPDISFFADSRRCGVVNVLLNKNGIQDC